MNELLFFESPPTIELCTNTFINVPVVLQYDETPLISVTSEERAGYSSEFEIYNSDGVYIAKVKGSRLLLTEDGKKSNFILRHPPNYTVCELNGQTMFEIHRDQAAALKTTAELYTPDGAFVKCGNNPKPELISSAKDHLDLSGLILSNSTFKNLSIGIWIQSKESTITIGYK